MELNKSYVDANKSDMSISDISTWFYKKRDSVREQRVSFFFLVILYQFLKKLFYF